MHTKDTITLDSLLDEINEVRQQALDNDDYMLINRGGSLKKIKVSNAGDYLNVMVGDDFVVSNGQYVVVP